MKATINFESEHQAQDSISLDELAILIMEDCKLSIKKETMPPKPGTKDGGLTIGLAIASLAVSAINTLISTLNYWRSQHPEYSIKISQGDLQITIDNITNKDINALINQLHAAKQLADIYVAISRD